jgi:hypothetical protein
MRIMLAGTVAGILWFASTAGVAQVLNAQPQIAQPVARDGGVREVLESIVIPPIPHAPFTATLATEATKYAAGGATMTSVNERRIARDAQGRVYQERWYLVPKNGKIKSSMNWIQLEDPKKHTLYNCSTAMKICELLVYDPSSELAAAARRRQGPSGALPNGDGNQSWEDLGHRNIAGVDTVGTRETTILNAGTMGNDEPLTSTSEYWHSDQLGINLLSVRSSPFFGKQTFNIIELTVGEPDAQLFALPAGYQINDQRKNPQISH